MTDRGSDNASLRNLAERSPKGSGGCLGAELSAAPALEDVGLEAFELEAPTPSGILGGDV